MEERWSRVSAPEFESKLQHEGVINSLDPVIFAGQLQAGTNPTIMSAPAPSAGGATKDGGGEKTSGPSCVPVSAEGKKRFEVKKVRRMRERW